MNPDALRYMARSIVGWWLTACSVVYVVLGAVSGAWSNSLPWAALFFGAACLSFAWRYADHGEKVEREAKVAKYAEERAERQAEQAASIARFEAERLERRIAKAQAIARGELCPDDCVECRLADERREAENREWLAERARAHGHRPLSPVEAAERVEAKLDELSAALDATKR